MKGTKSYLNINFKYITTLCSRNIQSFVIEKDMHLLFMNYSNSADAYNFKNSQRSFVHNI